MPFFQFKAVTPEGKVVEGTLEAADEKSAISRLEDQGQMPIRLSSEEISGLLGREFQHALGTQAGLSTRSAGLYL